MRKCKIQWIDKKGNPTPDNNPAVGIVYITAHTQDLSNIGGQSRYRFEESKKFPICQEHLDRFHRERLQDHFWVHEQLD